MTTEPTKNSQDIRRTAGENSSAADQFSGSRVLVTGGTRGIGAAVARGFLDAGAEVVVAARRPVADFFTPVVTADVSDPAAVEELRSQVTAMLGGVDILVDNAGAQSWTDGGLLAIDDQTWVEQLNLNLLSAVRVDRAFLPAMIERGHGVVIHLTSVSGHLPVAGEALPYSVAKAGLRMYSKGLANEVGRHGIRVNAIAPALVTTDGTRDLQAVREQQIDRLGAALGRTGLPHEVASAALFLASEAASFITGTELIIDGGVTPTT